MNTPETINIEKYAEALNNLVGMDIGYLGDRDKNVNAIVEVIVAAKKLENRVKELEGSLKMSEHLRKTAYERIEQLDELCGDLQKLKIDMFEEINEFINVVEWRSYWDESKIRSKISELEQKYVEGINE